MVYGYMIINLTPFVNKEIWSFYRRNPWHWGFVHLRFYQFI